MSLSPSQVRRHERAARMRAPFSPIPASDWKVPLYEQPRFFSIFAKVQAEVDRVQVHYSVTYLRGACFVDGRRATDSEIAVQGAFAQEKQEASAYGYQAGVAAARRLTRYYNLRSH